VTAVQKKFFETEEYFLTKRNWKKYLSNPTLLKISSTNLRYMTQQ